MRDFRADLTDIFNAAVDYARAERLTRERVMVDGECVILDASYTCEPKKIYMFAFGKAACGMARGFMSVCNVTRGVVASNTIEEFPDNIEVIKASHPLPDEGSLYAAERMLALAKEADKSTLCVFLVSGGGSSILASPAFGITLADKMKTFDLFIKSGAEIEEINTVRRHLSNVKGGRLAQAAYPAKCVTLAISDVLSGSPSAIASGPTYYDSSTWADAYEVAARYNLLKKLPASVRDALEKGLYKELPDTVKGTPDAYSYYIIGSNYGGVAAAEERAQELGYRVYRGGMLREDVTAAADIMASELGDRMFGTDKKPLCIIYGGEVTVKVDGNGKGGRCQQLAIEYLIHDKPCETYTLCASTDGMDGPTDAAGAFVDDGLDKDEAEVFAVSNNAYAFFEKNGNLLKTGLTGTNINDLYIIIIPASEIKPLMRAFAAQNSCCEF